MIEYRRDIDGLRAMAILPVVAYHAMPPVAPGGFTGVDIFFVISGYLITKLLLADIQQQRFSISRFYFRRTRRIFPALFCVMFSVAALAMLLLTPTELRDFAKTMAATAVFASNVVFWQDTGYFDMMAESKPLLHTWSLAIEEQFYLLWPLALVAIWRWRITRSAIIVVALASFLISLYFTERHQPTAFFLLPPRAWELLLGALLATGFSSDYFRQRVRRDAAATLGLLLILLSVAMLDHQSAFPGWAALMPCLGAALLIAAGESGSNIVSEKLLTRRPMVFFGLISYSLYLWHWPLLSLAHVASRGESPWPVRVALVLVAVVLSYCTWKFIEVPFRTRKPTGSVNRTLARYAVVPVVTLAAGCSLYVTDGHFRAISPALQRAESARYDINPLSGTCLRWQGDTSSLPGVECLSGPSSVTERLILWGDSHADAIAPAIVDQAAKLDLTTMQLTMAGCPPLLGANVEGPGARYDLCTAFNRQVFDYAVNSPEVSVIVLSSRWTLYTEPGRFGQDPGAITYLTDDKHSEWSSESSRKVFSTALAQTIAALRRHGKKVMILGTIPPLGVNVPDCLARNSMPLSGFEACDSSASIVRPHVAFADAEIERLASSDAGVCTFLPVDVICPGERCMAEKDGAILYANDDHLTNAGAAFVGSHLPLESCLTNSGPSAARADAISIVK